MNFTKATIVLLLLNVVSVEAVTLQSHDVSKKHHIKHAKRALAKKATREEDAPVTKKVLKEALAEFQEELLKAFKVIVHGEEKQTPVVAPAPAAEAKKEDAKEEDTDSDDDEDDKKKDEAKPAEKTEDKF